MRLRTKIGTGDSTNPKELNKAYISVTTLQGFICVSNIFMLFPFRTNLGFGEISVRQTAV